MSNPNVADAIGKEIQRAAKRMAEPVTFTRESTAGTEGTQEVEAIVNYVSRYEAAHTGVDNVPFEVEIKIPKESEISNIDTTSDSETADTFLIQSNGTKYEAKNVTTKHYFQTVTCTKVIS